MPTPFELSTTEFNFIWGCFGIGSENDCQCDSCVGPEFGSEFRLSLIISSGAYSILLFNSL